MITLAMARVVGADRGRVWRALTDPAELSAWNADLLGAAGRVDAYPTPGRGVRWRYLVGSVPQLLHERPQEVRSGERLRSSLALGALRAERTYVLCAAERTVSGEPLRTRVRVQLTLPNTVPVLGALVDRFAVRRHAAGYLDALLRALALWCEEQRGLVRCGAPPAPMLRGPGSARA